MRIRMALRRSLTPTIVLTSVVAVALVSLVVGSRAHAQSAAAELLFRDGNKLMAEGKLAQACDAFEASNRIEPRAGTLLRLGECREQNQQFASAWSAYRDALGRATDPVKRNFAAAQATALEARLSYLTVTVTDDSRIDGLTVLRNGSPFDPALWNRAVPVDGGDYVIAGHASGHDDWQTVMHVPVSGAKITVEVPKLDELGKRTPLLPAEASALSPPVAEPRHDQARPPAATFTTRRKIAVGVASAGVIAMVAGTILGESSETKRDDAYKLCPDPAMQCVQADQANALIKASYRRALEANLTFGIVAAAAIGAGVLWFTGAPVAEDPRRVSVVPSLKPGQAALVALGRF